MPALYLQATGGASSPHREPQGAVPALVDALYAAHTLANGPVIKFSSTPHVNVLFPAQTPAETAA